MAQGLDYRSDLSGVHFRIHRQRKDLIREFFGNREIPGLIAQLSKSLLEVHRDRIVNRSPDSGSLQMFLQSLAFWRSNGKNVEHMPGVGRFDRNLYVFDACSS